VIAADDLPSLGLHALVVRIASHLSVGQRDAVAFVLPWIAELRPQSDASWIELLTAAYDARKTAGKEVALAKTVAEAQAAQSRWTLYNDGIERVHRDLLCIAVRMLARGPQAMADGSYGGLVGHGRRNLGNWELIPAAHWEAGTIDWQRRQLKIRAKGGTIWEAVRALAAGPTIWSDVKVTDLIDLSPDDTIALVGHRPYVSQTELDDFVIRMAAHAPDGYVHTEQEYMEAAQSCFRGHEIPRQRLRTSVGKLPKRARRGRPRRLTT